MSTLQDTDIIVVGRGNTPYKCTFKDWKAAQMSVAKPRITTPAAGAVDLGETPTFTSSAFSATGAVTHASSDWQVTLKTDAAFASPVVQSMADATNKLSWDGGPLQPNTDYIARVRHNGSGGLQSPWSDVIGFKTKAAFFDLAVPGLVYQWDPAGTANATTVPSPVKMISLSVNDGELWGVGVDGNLYRSTGGAFAKDATASGNGTIQAVAQEYYGGLCYLTSNGSVYLHKTGYNSFATGLQINGAVSPIGRIGTAGKDSVMVYAISQDGQELWLLGESVVGTFAQFTKTSWTPPAGKKLSSIAMLQKGNGFMLCYTDGTLHCFGTANGIPQFTGGIWPSSPKVYTVPGLAAGEHVAKIANIMITYGSSTNLQFLTNQNRLYIYQNSGSGYNAFAGAQDKWYGSASDKFLSFIVMRFRVAKGIVIKNDHRIYQCPADASPPATLLPLAPGTTDNQNNTFGTLVYNYPANSSGPFYFILGGS